MKRILDIALSLIVVIVLTPLLVVIALVILLCEGRPILYIHDRVGKDRKLFRLIKFRTMVKNADALKSSLSEQNEAAFPFFKIKNDRRITPIGKILRKTSIDELPQLFNVLVGDMSIVGPRPVLPSESVVLNNDRFAVRPGITGPTQICRDKKLSLSERYRLELDYLQSRHILLTDLRIILKTVLVVFQGE